ncbi:amidase [Halorientalis salina]|uniref:amidase n=1 Tax=Halorientalis salina TaxID=2932266 RepID=UPI0010ACD87F|nr:amidase [Halorientalis salina]
MGFQPPSEEQLAKLGAELSLHLDDQEITDHVELITDALSSYETVATYEDDTAESMAQDRDGGERVVANDPYNAWITRCNISECNDGRLAGWDIAVKDNIGVGGVEMTCGSNVVEGYVPETDATLVSRLLSAGATIVGKTNLDDMAFSGNGHSSAFGPTLNPHAPEHLSGGSSGGSAIAVAREEVRVAIGSDQGGSIRAPASWTGVVGHKPTHGLVPYTGCVGIDNTVDHAGPIGRDVETVAETLTVLAGSDSRDPRQPNTVPTRDYASELDGNVEELDIAVLEEGFDQPECDPAVNDRVRATLDQLEDLGATVENVSLPIHDDAADIYSVSLAEGFLAAFRGEGLGHNWKGWYNTDWAREFGRLRREKGGQFPPTVKFTLLLGAYASDEYCSAYYAKAMNLRNELTEAYDGILEGYDLIAMPTTPMTAHEWKPDQDTIEFIGDAWTNLANTSAFNMTGHPSVSVPAGSVGDLPAGLMLTGRAFDDATVLNAAHAVEGR